MHPPSPQINVGWSLNLSNQHWSGEGGGGDKKSLINRTHAGFFIFFKSFCPILQVSNKWCHMFSSFSCPYSRKSCKINWTSASRCAMCKKISNTCQKMKKFMKATLDRKNATISISLHTLGVQVKIIIKHPNTSQLAHMLMCLYKAFLFDLFYIIFN